MTTYDRDEDVFIVPVAYNGVSYIRVKGVDDAVDAQHAAVKAIKGSLADEIEGLDITIGTWPLDHAVVVGDTNLEDVEVI